jgi:hypothetical protein
MESKRTKTADYKKDSLRKMSISFLVSDEQGTIERGCYIDDDTKRNGTNAGPHQHHTAIVATGSCHSGDQPFRVERYAADGEDGTLCDQGQWSRGQPNQPMNIVHPQRSTIFPDQLEVDNRGVPFNDSALLRLAGLTSPTPKRSQSTRLVYTHEEKLFVMHSRVIGSISWQKISKIFENIFRTKGTKHTVTNLRILYYRTRRDWGMDHMTHSGSDRRQGDEMVVKAKMREHAGRPLGPRAMSQA